MIPGGGFGRRSRVEARRQDDSKLLFVDLSGPLQGSTLCQYVFQDDIDILAKYQPDRRPGDPVRGRSTSFKINKSEGATSHFVRC